jgi:putative ABC transport system permease protein
MFQTDTLADVVEVIGLVHWLGYACVGLVLALVATTTLMAVQDRIKEHGVLQTMGFRPRAIFRLVVTESVLLSSAGGVLGIGTALVVLGWSGMSIAAEGVTIAFSPTVQLAGTAAIIPPAVGLIAGLAPGWQAASTQIVRALRHG